MQTRYSKAFIAASAILAGAGWISVANAEPVSLDTSPVATDGWTISWPAGVGLTINQDANNPTQVDLQKTATFTAPDQGFQITFAPGAATGATTANVFVIPSELITNQTGSPFAAFSFILLNTGSVDATFGGSPAGFSAPSGTGYNYTSVSLVNGETELDYIGTQSNGVTSIWGNGDPSSSGDNLVIDAPAGSDFALKELSVSGPSAIPLPASVWQSLVGLSGLALIAGTRALIKRQTK